MRLARMIALSSELSRRAAEKAITEGVVSVNGRVITVLSTVVDPRSDKVILRGCPLKLARRRTYIAFHKPRGCLVTKSDPQGRPTIWEHLKVWKEKLNSVGRLDFDSEGLLLLADDGDFINCLTHPRHEIWKTYRVRIKGEPNILSLRKLREGVELKGGRTLPARVRRVDQGDANALIEIAIREGKNRQVRRMFEAIGFPVTRLKRMAVGPVRLGGLKIGEWRYLRSREIAEIQSTVRDVSR